MKEKKNTNKEVKEPKKQTKEPKKTIKINNDIEVVNKTVEFTLVEVIVIILLTGIVVSIASGLIVYNNYEKINNGKSNNTSSSINNNSNNKIDNDELSEIHENYNYIVNNYIEKVDKNELIDAAISGMYNYLSDEYTTYLSVNDSSDFNEQLEGEYTGIGIEIKSEVNSKGEVITSINRVFSNSPAEEAGLKEGDLLLKIDDKEVTDASFIANYIKKGNKDTFTLVYKREKETKTINISRKKVNIDSVSYKTYGNVGYIKIETFSNATTDQVKKAIDSLGDVKSLVLDLRNNTGGYLYTAYKIADLFVEKGKPIYQIKDRDDNVSTVIADDDVYKKFNKIAVLINGNSASASEVLTLALKESANAKVVGTKSYGKGTIQDTKILSSGAMVKYTSGYWLSPKGNSINKKGITPDIIVKEEKNQIDKAVKAVK